MRAAARGTNDAASNAPVEARALRQRDELAAAGRGRGSARGCRECSGDHRRNHSRRHGVRGLGRECVGSFVKGFRVETRERNGRMVPLLPSPSPWSPSNPSQ